MGAWEEPQPRRILEPQHQRVRAVPASESQSPSAPDPHLQRPPAHTTSGEPTSSARPAAPQRASQRARPPAWPAPWPQPPLTGDRVLRQREGGRSVPVCSAHSPPVPVTGQVLRKHLLRSWLGSTLRGPDLPAWTRNCVDGQCCKQDRGVWATISGPWLPASVMGAGGPGWSASVFPALESPVL